MMVFLARSICRFSFTTMNILKICRRSRKRAALKWKPFEAQTVELWCVREREYFINLYSFWLLNIIKIPKRLHETAALAAMKVEGIRQTRMEWMQNERRRQNENVISINNSFARRESQICLVFSNCFISYVFCSRRRQCARTRQSWHKNRCRWFRPNEHALQFTQIVSLPIRTKMIYLVFGCIFGIRFAKRHHRPILNWDFRSLAIMRNENDEIHLFCFFCRFFELNKSKTMLRFCGTHATSRSNRRRPQPTFQIK